MINTVIAGGTSSSSRTASELADRCGPGSTRSHKAIVPALQMIRRQCFARPVPPSLLRPITAMTKLRPSRLLVLDPLNKCHFSYSNLDIQRLSMDDRAAFLLEEMLVIFEDKMRPLH